MKCITSYISHIHIITFIKTYPVHSLYPTNAKYVYMPTTTYKEKKNIEAKYISIDLCIDYIYL